MYNISNFCSKYANFKCKKIIKCLVIAKKVCYNNRRGGFMTKELLQIIGIAGDLVCLALLIVLVIRTKKRK